MLIAILCNLKLFAMCNKKLIDCKINLNRYKKIANVPQNSIYNRFTDCTYGNTTSVKLAPFLLFLL